MICTATVHGTTYAYRAHRCRCPEAIAAMRPARRRSARQAYVPGRSVNLRGARKEPPDPVAVDRAVSGDRSIQITPAERRAAVDQLDRHGLSAAQIAILLGCTTRTVQRCRADLRAQGSSGGNR